MYGGYLVHSLMYNLCQTTQIVNHRQFHIITHMRSKHNCSIMVVKSGSDYKSLSEKLKHAGIMLHDISTFKVVQFSLNLTLNCISRERFH